MVDQKEEIHKLIVDNEPFLLVILDAARYDVFAKVNWLKGNLQKAKSPGSTTSEWVADCFDGWYPGLVYVSSIPYIASKYMPEIHGNYRGTEHFYELVDVWDWGYDWDYMTVLPRAVFEAVVNIHQVYPDRSIVAHFIQPHSPMVGSPLFTLKNWESMTGEKTNGRFPSVKDIFDRGHGDYYIRAYEGNLRLVLDVVQGLVANWDTKVVITADHGEGFGESGVYGHKAGIRTPELVGVPWFSPSP